MIRHLLTLLVIFLFFCSSTFSLAQVTAPLTAPPSSRSNEYFVGQEYGKPLITVNLVNGVKQPGVYHVPINTDLSQLLAFAGGATNQSDLEQVAIRRTQGPKYHILDVNFEKAMRSTSTLPTLKDRDVIHIEQKPSVERTLRWVTLISGIVSIGLSVALINDIERRR